MAHTLRLGVFIVGTLILLALGTYLIGQRQFMFSDTYRISTTFKTVTGLTEGAEVRVGGIRQGIVKHIRLPQAPQGEMRVEMNMEKSTRDVLRADSVATIGSEGLLGSKYIDISFGSEKAPVLDAGATIASVPPVDLNDMVKRADAALGDVRGKVATVTAKAAEGADAFAENMKAMRSNFFLKGFFKDRGYEDEAELRAHLIAQAPRAAPLQTFTYDVKKIFESVDHAELKSGRPLDNAGKFLQTTPFGLTIVLATAGMRGDSQDLQLLLQARALVVRDYLVKNFRMNDTRVKTMVRGKGPAATTDDGTIEVIVYPESVRSKNSGARR